MHLQAHKSMKITVRTARTITLRIEYRRQKVSLSHLDDQLDLGHVAAAAAAAVAVAIGRCAVLLLLLLLLQVVAAGFLGHVVCVCCFFVNACILRCEVLKR